MKRERERACRLRCLDWIWTGFGLDCESEHLNSGEIIAATVAATGCDWSNRLHSTWPAFRSTRAKGKGKVKGKSKDKGGGSC